MSQYAKQYKEFFQESEAGQILIASLTALAHSEHVQASNTVDMQEVFAHMQRAKGVQLAVSKIENMMVESKKPERMEFIQ
jgi:hypothetical protein